MQVKPTRAAAADRHWGNPERRWLDASARVIAQDVSSSGKIVNRNVRSHSHCLHSFEVRCRQGLSGDDEFVKASLSLELAGVAFVVAWRLRVWLSLVGNWAGSYFVYFVCSSSSPVGFSTANPGYYFSSCRPPSVSDHVFLSTLDLI